MKINKLNKFIYILFFVFAFLIGNNKVLAIDYNAAKNKIGWQNNGSIVCGYTNHVNGADIYIMIGFNFELKQWQVFSYPAIGTSSLVSYGTPASILPTMINGNTRISYQGSSASNLLNNGVCPSEAYSKLMDGGYICFGSLEYCEDLGLTKIGGTSSINSEETLEQKLGENVARITCDEMLKTDDSASVLNLVGFKYNVNGFPVFMQTQYNNVIEKFNSKLERCKTEKLAELDEREKKCKEYLRSGNKVLYEECMATIDEEKAKLDEKVDNITSELEEFIINKDDLTVTKTCEEIVGPNLKAFFKIVYIIIKILSTVLIVVLSMLDFVKATSSSEPDKDMKKAFTKFVKRLVIIVVIFALPLLLEIIKAIWPTLDLTCIVG